MNMQTLPSQYIVKNLLEKGWEKKLEKKDNSEQEKKSLVEELKKLF